VCAEGKNLSASIFDEFLHLQSSSGHFAGTDKQEESFEEKKMSNLLCHFDVNPFCSRNER
jgi:hypothetical protein